MQSRLTHSILFDFDGHASVAEVAKSLIAQEQLLKDAISIIEECFPRLKIDRVELLVRSVEQNSPLREVFVAIVVAAYGPELGEEVPDIVKQVLGIDISSRYDGVVSILVLLVVIYGFDWLVRRIFASRDDKKLEDERKRLIEAVAKEMNLNEVQVTEAVNRALGKRQKSVIKSAIDIFRPARRLGARKIEVGGGVASVEQDIIKRFPSEAEMAQFEPETDVKLLEGVTILFRAHDLDKNEKWAATIEEVSPQRKPLHVAPSIDVKKLFDRRQVVGDVLVNYMADDEGQLQPKLYYLQSVRDI
jgi:hypothetical protein